MIDRDIDRLYVLIDSLRNEVVGYRADLNGRLKALETAEAHRMGADKTRGSFGRVALGIGALAAAVATILNVVLSRI
jgi:hypothetical protein